MPPFLPRPQRPLKCATATRQFLPLNSALNDILIILHKTIDTALKIMMKKNITISITEETANRLRECSQLSGV